MLLVKTSLICSSILLLVSKKFLRYYILSCYFVECSNTLRALKGDIKTPQFPDIYPHDQDCLWKIELRKGYQIVIKFGFFKLHSISAGGECIDYVDVHQNGNDNKFIGRFCGSSNPGTIRVHSNQASLRLHTSKYGSVKTPAGFHATYHAEGEYSSSVFIVARAVRPTKSHRQAPGKLMTKWAPFM